MCEEAITSFSPSGEMSLSMEAKAGIKSDYQS